MMKEKVYLSDVLWNLKYISEKERPRLDMDKSGQQALRFLQSISTFANL